MTTGNMVVSPAALAPSPSAASPSRKIAAAGLRGLRHALYVFSVWRNRLEQRRRLMHMSDYSLRDIGLTRGDVYWEINKPFWRM